MPQGKKIFRPKVECTEQTWFGKLFATDPKAHAEHEKMVSELRKVAREDVEACERSQRITYEDLHGPTFHCT